MRGNMERLGACLSLAVALGIGATACGSHDIKISNPIPAPVTPEAVDPTTAQIQSLATSIEHEYDMGATDRTKRNNSSASYSESVIVDIPGVTNPYNRLYLHASKVASDGAPSPDTVDQIQISTLSSPNFDIPASADFNFAKTPNGWEAKEFNGQSDAPFVNSNTQPAAFGQILEDARVVVMAEEQTFGLNVLQNFLTAR